MKYYKIISNNTCIGIANSNNFILYRPDFQSFTAANEITGDLVEYKNNFYRALWMKPITSGITIKYSIVDIIEITEEQYHFFEEAFKENEIIEEEEQSQPDYIQPYVPPEAEGTDFIRSSKINAMSYTCRKAIEQGFDLILRGESHHFSLTTQDQLNLMNLDITQELIPYHADGEQYTYYTADEIKQIINAANDHKVYHTAYYNSLKEYINTLETIEDIAAVTYGTPIPDKYKSEVLKVFEEYTQPFHS